MAIYYRLGDRVTDHHCHDKRVDSTRGCDVAVDSLMLIILDGPDGAGKSTLARRLRDRLVADTAPGTSVRILHKKAPVTDPVNEYLVPLAGYQPGNEQHVICDRWHWGERVYPVVFSRPTELDRVTWWYLEAFLQSRGAVVVYVTASPEVLATRLYARDEVVDMDQLRSAILLFNRTWSYSYLRRIYNLAEDGQAFPTVDMILHEGRTAEYCARDVVRGYPTYAGPLLPGILLMGDSRGKLHPGIPTAFTPIPRNSSGRYLLESLPRTWLERNQVGVVNACEGNTRIEYLVKQLRDPQLVALGGNASRRTQSLDRGTVPHPGFIRRFHYKSHTQYGEMIATAAQTRKDYSGWRP